MRIVAMLLIVSCHVVANIPWNLEDDGDTVSRAFAIAWDQYAGQIGVCIFFLLSGYFLVNKTFRASRILSVVVQTFLYSAPVIALQAVLLAIHPSDGISAMFSKGQLFHTLYSSLLPVFNGTYWFITAYVLMMLASPYLNRILHDSERSSRNCIVLLLAVSMMPVLSLSPSVWTTWTYAITVYLIGGWMRLYGVDLRVRFNCRWQMSVIYVVAAYAMLSAFVYASLRFGFWDWLRSDERRTFGVIPLLELAIAAMLLMMTASLRQSVRNVKSEKRGRVIMTISSSVFGVYLIHENPYVRANLWRALGALIPAPGNAAGVIVETVAITAGLFVMLSAAAFMYDAIVVHPIQRLLKLRS